MEEIGQLTKLKKPPSLKGYTYSGRRAYAARDNGQLLAIRIETNHTCNLRCLYCYAESGKDAGKVVDFAVLKSIVRQARGLGCESIVVIGGGEPTIYPQFRELITYISNLGMIPMVFTNCLRVDKKLAKFLYDSNASVMGKLDSFRSDLQDYLAGAAGAAVKIRRGLDNLMDAGFGSVAGEELRLGVSFVSSRLNLGEIPAIWHFCRINNIFPNMEVLTPTGRAVEHLDDCCLDTESIQAYKLKLLEMDRVYYGFDWLPYTPLAGSGCLQHLYSLYITASGDVRPCAPTKFDEHPALRINGIYPYNVHRRSIKEVYQSALFRYVRNIDGRLEGKCARCGHHDQCIGCRGYSYSTGINEGMNPAAALRSECRQCAKPQE